MDSFCVPSGPAEFAEVIGSFLEVLRPDEYGDDRIIPDDPPNAPPDAQSLAEAFGSLNGTIGDGSSLPTELQADARALGEMMPRLTEALGLAERERVSGGGDKYRKHFDAAVAKTENLAVRLYAKAVEQEAATAPRRWAAAAAKQTAPDPPAEKHGLEPPNILWWQGKPQELQPRHWKLLEFMWDRDSAEIEDVVSHVWDRDDVQETTFKSALSKLNGILAELPSCRIQLRIKSGYLTKDVGKVAE